MSALPVVSEAVDVSDLVDERAAAAVFGMSVHTLREWRYVGRGPSFFKIGRSIRYSRKVLAEWLAAQKVG